MKYKLMIVEDELTNMICALSAFDGMNEVEVGDVHGTVSGALKMIDEFQPTMALLDINIKEGSGVEIGKVLGSKGVPYVYVTAIGSNHHGTREEVEIQDQKFQALEKFEGHDKNPEIWQRGFKILKEKIEGRKDEDYKKV